MQFKHNVEISIRDNGQLLVERRIAGVLTDRFHTHDLTKPIKRSDKWITDTIALCSQPSAGIEIDIPPVPELEPSQADNIVMFKGIQSAQAQMIKNLRRQDRLAMAEPKYDGHMIDSIKEAVKKAEAQS